MSNPFLGEIRMFAGTFAPAGWALCNGQSLAISTNAALFSIIGTTYGGNGTTVFSLPDLRSRVPIHAGQGASLSLYNLGETAGVESVTILQGNLPAHTHPVNCNTGGGGQASPQNNLPAVESTGTSLNYASSANATMSASMIGTTGNNLPIQNIQPVLCVNFIIALTGIFPSRN
jgi:microcystin-dependent protein